MSQSYALTQLARLLLTFSVMLTSMESSGSVLSAPSAIKYVFFKAHFVALTSFNYSPFLFTARWWHIPKSQGSWGDRNEVLNSRVLVWNVTVFATHISDGSGYMCRQFWRFYNNSSSSSCFFSTHHSHWSDNFWYHSQGITLLLYCCVFYNCVHFPHSCTN